MENKERNIKTASDRIDVMQAYLNGETIEYINKLGRVCGSFDINMLEFTPTWDFDEFEYVIKPNQVNAPLTCEDLKSRIIAGEPMWVEMGHPKSIRNITSFNEKMVCMGSCDYDDTDVVSYTYEELATMCVHFINSDPFYKTLYKIA